MTSIVNYSSFRAWIKKKKRNMPEKNVKKEAKKRGKQNQAKENLFVSLGWSRLYVFNIAETNSSQVMFFFTDVSDAPKENTARIKAWHIQPVFIIWLWDGLQQRQQPARSILEEERFPTSHLDALGPNLNFNSPMLLALPVLLVTLCGASVLPLCLGFGVCWPVLLSTWEHVKQRKNSGPKSSHFLCKPGQVVQPRHERPCRAEPRRAPSPFSWRVRRLPASLLSQFCVSSAAPVWGPFSGQQRK